MSEPKPRPQPIVDPDAEPFWNAAKEGRLLVQRCGACGKAQLYGRASCTSCHSTDVAWEEASGRGTVHTFTVIRQHFARPFREMVPYVVALVDLDEGARLMSNVTGVDPEDVQIGMTVKVRFEEDLPMFEPA